MSSTEFPWAWTNFKSLSKFTANHIKLLKFSQDTSENKTVGFAYVDTSGAANTAFFGIAPEFKKVYTTIDFTVGMTQFLGKHS